MAVVSLDIKLAPSQRPPISMKQGKERGWQKGGNTCQRGPDMIGILSLCVCVCVSRGGGLKQVKVEGGARKMG